MHANQYSEFSSRMATSAKVGIVVLRITQQIRRKANSGAGLMGGIVFPPKSEQYFFREQNRWKRQAIRLGEVLQGGFPVPNWH